MSKASSAIERRSAPSAAAPDSDVLPFLSRTLQAHFLDAKPQDVLAKLQNLKLALEQQENTLSAWPDSASKSRICNALAKARLAVSQIVEDLSATTQRESNNRAANAL
jgi:hypothetical protein